MMMKTKGTLMSRNRSIGYNSGDQNQRLPICLKNLLEKWRTEMSYQLDATAYLCLVSPIGQVVKGKERKKTTSTDR